MASTKANFVSIHGKRLGLKPNYALLDGAPMGPPLNVSADAVAGNSATTAEVTLKSYSLPAFSLKNANHGVYVTAFGRFAGNAQNKRATLNIGGISITTASTTNSGGTWMLQGQYIKTAASAQRAITGGQIGSTALALASATDTTTDTSDITISLKATSGSGSQSDILCDALIVGFN
jgi:hypothetical protein